MLLLPSLRRSSLMGVLLWRRMSAATTAATVRHSYHIRSAIEGLVEIADVA
jgi:hypothetical protein